MTLEQGLWVGSIILTLVLALFGGYAAAMRDRSAREQRIHARIDAVILDATNKIDALRKETKEDGDGLRDDVDRKLSEDRKERDTFRQLIFDRLGEIKESIGRLGGIMDTTTANNNVGGNKR